MLQKENEKFKVSRTRSRILTRVDSLNIRLFVTNLHHLFESEIRLIKRKQIFKNV